MIGERVYECINIDFQKTLSGTQEINDQILLVEILFELFVKQVSLEVVQESKNYLERKY